MGHLSQKETEALNKEEIYIQFRRGNSHKDVSTGQITKVNNGVFDGNTGTTRFSIDFNFQFK